LGARADVKGKFGFETVLELKRTYLVPVACLRLLEEELGKCYRIIINK
jgi:hypothetical protein